MALSSAVISFDIADLLGNDFNPAKTRVSVTTNVPDGVIADTVGNQIRVGDGVVQIGADGTGTVSVWIPGTGSNPASWQTYIHLDATPSRSGVGRTPKTFGPFTITGDANLADLIQEQEIPPTYLSEVAGALQVFLDEAESSATDAEAAQVAAEAAEVAAIAARDDAVDISGISTSDGVVEALIKGTGGAGALTRPALLAQFAPLIGAPVNRFGADPTGVADSTSAFVAALASLPTQVVNNGTTSKTYRVGRLVLGQGTYKLGSTADIGNLGPWVDVIGPGHNLCFIDYRGGDAPFRAWNEVDPRYPSNTFDVMFDQDKPRGQGARYNGFTIDGTNSQAGAIGLHVGDFEGGNLGPELFIQHFNKTGSVGIWWDNLTSWSENWRGSASLYDCTTHVLMSKSSMSYNHLDFKIYARHNQKGIVLTQGAAYYHGTLKATANFEVAPTGTPNTGAFLVIGTGVDDPGVPGAGSWLKDSHIAIMGECVRTEVSTQSAAVPAGSPRTVVFGDLTKDKLDGCTGLLSFGGQVWSQSNWVESLDNHMGFDGVITGDDTLNPAKPFMTNPFPVRAPVLPVSTLTRTLKKGAYYSSSSTIDLQSGDYFDLGQLAADVTLVFGNPIANSPRRIMVRAQQSGTLRKIIWPNAGSPSIGNPTVLWEGGVPPLLTRVGSGVDMFDLWTDTGTIWYGRQRPSFAINTLPVGTYRGRGSSATATLAVTPSATIPVGSTLFALLGCTTDGATATPTLTDAQGHTWVLETSAGDTGPRAWVYRTVVTTPISGAVTATWSAATGSYMTLLEVTGLGSAPKLDRLSTVVQGAAASSFVIAPNGPTQKVAEISVVCVVTSGGGTQWVVTGNNPAPLGAWAQSTAGATNEAGQAAWLSLPSAGNASEIKFTPTASRRVTAILATYSA